MRLEIVTIFREDHPNGKVDINKSDLKPDDVIYESKLEQKQKKRSKKAK